MEKEALAYPLGDDDIHEVLPNVKIMSYPSLAGMRSIDQCFDKEGRSIILFPNMSPTMGHWCCMIKRPDSIEFFDPYGEAPEEQKGGMSETRLEELNIDRPYLTRLMRNSGLPIYYNNHPFQSSRGSVATCGRHCAMRLYFKDLSLEEYANVIKKSGLTPDQFVVGATYDTVQK
ncbi:MAG: putative cysteine protease [Yellowstone Lake virophage 5]|jgi:hypothetical protein|uniref:Putative cysteine protease n=1 Tax=Yellowstone Lake virophage 5 TaxID=1557033 RepID=A0A0A0RPB3_9VIRU|nr:MAG: putative cysteine protease [Yellowstone Lake virophage 5]AIW01877.1 MAG: putative cysteine protease [Yellowstone Lake virophage 5]